LTIIPGRSSGERFFATVRGQFLVELADGQLAELGELNRLFTAWVEREYHRRPHGETGQPPLRRWLAGGPFPQPAPAQLAEAFKWSERRQVSSAAVVKLFANRYEVDPALAGRAVELVFDPFDLTVVEVRRDGKPMGLAVPQVIGRHSHPKARPEQPAADPPRTNIDYLGIPADQHQAAIARRINYDALASPEDNAPPGDAPPGEAPR
jgi:putative transposase